MNIVLKHNDFNIENINLLKKRNNTVIEGTFTKFTYSDENLTMNGIYLQLPIYNMVVNKDDKITAITFQPYDKQNIEYIQYITSIETQILKYYNNMNRSNKKLVGILTNKLYSGNIRSHLSTRLNINNTLTIKISGIWETNGEIGLAIKLIHNVDF
jgi:hypothetical protein